VKSFKYSEKKGMTFFKTTGIIFGVFGTFIQLLWLMRGESPSDTCTSSQVLSQKLIRIVNCDEEIFVNMTMQPKIVLNENYVFQSRPLMGYLGYFVMLLLKYFNLDLFKLGNATPNIIINFAILLISFYLFFKIIYKHFCSNKQQLYLSLVISSIYLFINPINKAFVWTAHSQMFNILIPILNIYLFFEFKKKILKIQDYVILFVVSILVLAYSGFLIIIASLFVYLLFSKRIKDAILVFIFGTLPYGIYYLYVLYRNLSFYSHEVVMYRQFVWVLDAFKGGDLLFALNQKINGFVYILSDFFIYSFLLLILINIVIVILLTGPKFKAFFPLKNSMSGLFFLLFIHLIFLFFLGFYASRLLFGTFSYLLLLLFLLNRSLVFTKNFKSIVVLFSYFLTLTYWIFINLRYPFPYS